MLGGKTVIMAGAIIRGDLFKKREQRADGEAERGPQTAITVGRCDTQPSFRMTLIC